MLNSLSNSMEVQTSELFSPEMVKPSRYPTDTVFLNTTRILHRSVLSAEAGLYSAAPRPSAGLQQEPAAFQCHPSHISAAACLSHYQQLWYRINSLLFVFVFNFQHMPESLEGHSHHMNTNLHSTQPFLFLLFIAVFMEENKLLFFFLVSGTNQRVLCCCRKTISDGVTWSRVYTLMMFFNKVIFLSHKWLQFFLSINWRNIIIFSPFLAFITSSWSYSFLFFCDFRHFAARFFLCFYFSKYCWNCCCCCCSLRAVFISHAWVEERFVWKC